MTHQKVYIIAEAGVNHNGDFELAKKLIEEGKKVGADCVKFQTWKTEDLITKTAPKADYQKKNDTSSTQFEMLKKLELSYADFGELQKYAQKIGIDFLSTPDELSSLNFLSEELNLPIIKVGSGEINNLLFLKQIGQKRSNVILSTGMSNISDVEQAYYTLKENGAKEITILHCTSDYPAPFETLNLSAMNTLKTVFQTKVGYSDHTKGIEASIAAVAMGAEVIEKHFTLDNDMEGPDHKASLNPSDFKAMVEAIRNVELSLGDGLKRIQKNEIETQKVVKKGIYSNVDLNEGTVLTEEHLVGKRPIQYIGMELYTTLLGKKLNKFIPKGQAIDWKDIAF